MAYKFATGSVRRGDIYNEDDTQGNTYLDWNEDALGVVAGGTTVFVVSGSTPLVGVGTDSPDYTLDVAGNIGVNEYIYHNDDTDTYIRFQGDKISLFAGNKNMLKLEEATNDKVLVNPAGVDIDFRVNGENVTDLFNTDALNDRVAVGTDSGNSTFEVSGSQGGNLVDTAVNLTLNETHFMVSITDEVTGTLPTANGCGGRIYHIFNQAGGEAGGSIEISCSAADTIDGQSTLTIDSSDDGGGNSSVSLVSNGSDGWLIFGQYSPQEESP